MTGASRYGADVDLEGQLYARIVRSEVPHGRLLGIDTAAAASTPGVVAVFTAADIDPDVRVPVRLLPTASGERALQAPLAREVVRYVGDPIAVVVAEDPYVAEDAASLVFAEIEPIDAVVDTLAAVDPSAPLVHEGIGTNVLDRFEVRHGDPVEHLLAEADAVVETELRIQRHGAVPLEPRALVAAPEEDGERISVWGAAKVKHFNRRALAEMLGVEESSIRLIECDVGGGFGARGEFYPEDYLIPWIARRLGAPVKWVEDRRENLIALNHSREQVWRVTAGATSDGALLGFRAEAWFNQGAYARTHGSALLPRLMINHVVGPYRWRGFEVTTGSVLTNKTGAGTYRGPGQYEPNYVRERVVEMLAVKLGIDPAEMRRRNLIEPEHMPYELGVPAMDSGNPVVVSDGDYPATLKALLERLDLDGMRAEAERRRAAGELVGVGVTTFIEMGSPGSFEQARAVAEPDGTFTFHVGVASVGQGVETVLTQIAADRLGVGLERVRVTYQDTDVIPEGLGAFSSRATVFGGNAIIGAVRALHERATAAAAERLGVAEKSIVIEGGRARVKRGKRTVELGELGVEATYRYEPDHGSHVVVGANLAFVRVDPETGGIEVLRYGVSFDVGKAINPLTLEGQAHGGVVQGLGGALLEEFAYSEDGQPLSTSFMDYLMPTAAEAAPIEVLVLELAEAVDGNVLAGAKGGGEGGIIGIGATIANAVADAVGAGEGELCTLPLTPERVRAVVRRRVNPPAR